MKLATLSTTLARELPTSLSLAFAEARNGLARRCDDDVQSSWSSKVLVLGYHSSVLDRHNHLQKLESPCLGVAETASQHCSCAGSRWRYLDVLDLVLSLAAPILGVGRKCSDER